jgi:hypothetical protein
MTTSTTARYTHAAQKAMERIRSPLDKLDLSGGTTAAKEGDVD